MRVISGTAKGRKLFRPKSESDIRPITDRAKESLFSIVGPAIQNRRFLDLFAGTGSVGIEALSRGAVHASFVDHSPTSARLILRNLDHTRLAERARIIKQDVFTYLATAPMPFDFIFIAPPQFQDLWSRTLHDLDERSEWLERSGCIICQIDPVEFRHLDLAGLRMIDQRRYSKVMFCFYRPALSTR